MKTKRDEKKGIERFAGAWPGGVEELDEMEKEMMRNRKKSSMRNVVI